MTKRYQLIDLNQEIAEHIEMDSFFVSISCPFSGKKYDASDFTDHFSVSVSVLSM